MFNNFYPSNLNASSTILCDNDEDSTEAILYQYLQPHFLVNEDVPTTTTEDSPGFLSYPEKTGTLLESVLNMANLENSLVQLQLSSFTDLQHALNDIGMSPSATTSVQRKMSLPHVVSSLNASAHHNRNSTQNDTENENSNERRRSPEGELAYLRSTETLPLSIHLNAESSCMIESLMERAISHWCCIGFKVAPITLDVIRDWRRAPPAIVYSVASISLVTFMDHKAGQPFIKEAAMVFYQQARRKMDDVFLEDMQPLIIQAYFCLSYTSNLLRLYEQQRTWGSLASIALQQRVRDRRRPMDITTMVCWFRWYYVDAWMCLTLNRECLLPDDMLQPETMDMLQPDATQTMLSNHPYREQYHFAVLTQYMRQYIRAMQSGHLFSPSSGSFVQPSPLYQSITERLKTWYRAQQKDTVPMMPTAHTSADITDSVHLRLCYNAVRLVVMFQFLQPQQRPPHDILIDCLETNLVLLQALQHLRDVGCDQSTYHHMFFAIHNTAKRIYAYEHVPELKPYAREQLWINLSLLKGTQAYINDVFKVRIYAEKIEQQFKEELRLPLDGFMVTNGGLRFLHAIPSAQQEGAIQQPALFVFRTKEINSPRRQRQPAKKSKALAEIRI